MLTKTISNRTTYSRAKKTNIQSFIPTVENKLWLESQQKATNKTYTRIYCKLDYLWKAGRYNYCAFTTDKFFQYALGVVPVSLRKCLVKWL